MRIQSDIEGKGIPALEDLRDAVKSKDQAAAQKAAQELQAIETTKQRQAGERDRREGLRELTVLRSGPKCPWRRRRAPS